MKKSKQKEIQQTTQTYYIKMLKNLRNIVSSDYRKALDNDYQGIILGYD